MAHETAHEDTPNPADSWAALLSARARREHTVLGLMSGTSADGIDVAIVRLWEENGALRHAVLAFETIPYDEELSVRVLRAGESNVRALCALDAELGVAFGEAANRVIRKWGIDRSAIDFVGSHGQTIVHLPPRDGARGSTMQLGCAATIAATTRLPVVSGFRSRDMALYGQGAPLVPLVDHLLFAKPGENRVLLNIGGIANLTAVNGNLDDVIAFDTGPGNALLDELASITTLGIERFDRDGERSSRGKVDGELLAELLADPFITAAPPKSADRHAYGESLARRLLDRGETKRDDLLATAAAFTADSILLAIERLPPPFSRIDRVIASGGGIHNRAILDRLRKAGRFPVETTAQHGLDPDAKEAVAFAVLARETILGRPGNLSRVTGARQRAILGSITL